jgi:glycine/D-amino acid oxidase-like deaminating enzyme
VGLNPLVIDGHSRLITAKIPNAGRAGDAALHFAQFLDFLHRAYPATRDIRIELASYWTGRTFNAADNYPKLYAPAPGVFALVNLGAWGNVMAPLLGMNLANALASDRPSDIVLPIEPMQAVQFPMALEFSVRRLLIPAAKIADRLGIF